MNNRAKGVESYFFMMGTIKGKTCGLVFVRPGVCEWYFIHGGVMKNMQQNKLAAASHGK
jgi:hypothetical protein